MTSLTRDLRNSPLTVEYAIDKMTDVDRLRDLAIQFWRAMRGQHEVFAHFIEGDCEPCRDAADNCDPDLACVRYQAWQRQYSDAIGAV
jgi:hypothetical protein